MLRSFVCSDCLIESINELIAIVIASFTVVVTSFVTLIIVIIVPFAKIIT
jgi:hypothetical protein